MRLADFDFNLPEELIALAPAARRDHSRLMRIGTGAFTHHQFSDLPTFLEPGDVLVVNDTKVLPAALPATRGGRSNGGGGPVAVSINLLSEVCSDEQSCTWSAFARPGKRLRAGDEITLQTGDIAEIVGKDGAQVQLRFGVSPGAFPKLLAAAGDMPLPPYIAKKRAADNSDRERYQTVFADRAGSVAAPTAGLHFTDDLLRVLQDGGVNIARVTLHVGAGTFLPVTTDRIEEHKMHAEWGQVSAEAASQIMQAKAASRRVVCVGTTSTRLVETAATDEGELPPWSGESEIFIRPGYTFKIVDALITNFHLPKSTLLMLISALAGRDRILTAYKEAIAERYRFFSYGDACFIEKAT